MTKQRFSQSDRRAILLLIGVMVATAFIIAFHEPKRHNEPYKRFNRDSLVQKKHQDSLRRAARYQAVRDSYAQLKMERELRKKEREAAYQAMMDSFARLKAERQAAKAAREAEWQEKEAARIRRRDSLQALRPHKLAQGETIDLNTCDTLALQQVPGIGSYYAKAITNYRAELGGFHDTAQLLEIKSFPPQALSYFRLDNPTVEQMDINRASFNQLRKHPYLNFQQTKAIVEYREKYGRIENPQQLSLLDAFTSEDFQRLAPYLRF